MKDIREHTAVQFDDVDADSLFEHAINGDNEMEEHTFL
jgi:hypothetical protein